MDYKQSIAEFVSQVVAALGWNLKQEEIQNLLESPKDAKMGDWAFPCFSLAKNLKKAPPMIAKDLEAALNKAGLPGSLVKVVAVGPYLNFYINKADLANDLVPQILQGDFLKPRQRSGKRTMIEYSQPNTHKAFHVGHTRNVALGNALVHICAWSGDDVIAANYIGDVGTHIAKCLWQMKRSGADYKDFADKMTRGEFLGMNYAEADKSLDFSLLSKSPHPNVVSVQVESIETHPTHKGWNIVRVTDGKHITQVVSAGKGYVKGDIVPLAKPGSRIAGRAVQSTNKEGVTSDGMICSGDEISVNENTDKIYIFPKNTALGQEVANIFRIEDATRDIASVSEEILKREKEVSQILQALEAKTDPWYSQWMDTRKWSLDDFHEIYNWLGAHFDHYFYESEVAEPGKSIVKEYLAKNILVKSEGAVGADLSSFNLPFFLVLKSDGTGLYSTKDLALAKIKFDQFKVDKSVYVVDVAQSLHFQQVFRTLELMGYEQAKNCFHLAYGMVVLPDGKMSSRKGNVILLHQLRELLKEQIYQDFLVSYQGIWSDQEINEAIRKISVATIMYGMLNQDNNKNIVFDLKEWTARTGNTGPYMLYAYTRTRSILRELHTRFRTFDYKEFDGKLLTHETEEKVLSKLAQFPEIVAKAAERYEPQQLCIYLYELSKDFSRMYDHCSVLHAESDALKISRAALVDACGMTLQKGLELIGIQTLDRM